ncbi:unnamed protein product [Ostreobium quekettii]|uniref:Uncharacterized protein n=1 Tax=Ostreobium quekettii TaxID=121088 RepID=A0A8S1JDM8_9CHLO|nr:unnamed protein product [Ostreobium quekettii]
MRNREVLAQLPLDIDGGKIARCVIPALDPCSLEACIKSRALAAVPDGQPTTSLVSLPEGVWEEACQLPEKAFDCIRTGSPQSQAEFLDLSPDQAHQEEALGDQKIREGVWRKHFQIFSQDLGRLMVALGSSTSLEDHDKPLLHRMLVYLMTNGAWAITSFLLRSCMDKGIVVATGDRALSLDHIAPERLKELAQELIRTRQQGVGEGVLSVADFHH